MLSNCSSRSAFPFWRWSTTASARGCSDCFSIASKTAASFSAPGTQRMSLTRGRPSVMVPVLSSTTAVMRRARSRLSASLISMPFSAALPTPTIMAVGVASPKAQGQAITSTVTMASRPCTTPLLPPHRSQAPKVRTAMPSTTGTKTAAILSTSFCTGALLPWASRTVCMIWASSVAPPTFSASKRKLPLWLMVPANTRSAAHHPPPPYQPPPNPLPTHPIFFAGSHHYALAQLHPGKRNPLSFALRRFHVYPLGLQTHQFFNGRRGTALGPFLEPLAQQNKGNDDRRRLKIHMRIQTPVLPEVGPQHIKNAEHISNPRTQRHQSIHIGRAVLQLSPGVDKEVAPQPQHHRG